MNKRNTGRRVNTKITKKKKRGREEENNRKKHALPVK
jgi:hypothetical protein